MNRAISRSDFLYLGAGALAAASLGPLAKRVEAAQVEVVYFDAETMTMEEWERFFALDLRACWLCSRHVLPRRLDGPSYGRSMGLPPG